MRVLRFSCVLFAVLSWTTVLIAGDDGAQAVPRPPERQFILGISADGSVALDGKPIEPGNLRAASARLAQQVRNEEKDARRREDLDNSPAAGILVWAADDVPCSLIYPRLIDCQAGGFRRWWYALRSVYPDPTKIPPSRAIRSRVRKEESDLPELLRTLPVRLRADAQGKLRRVEVGEKELDGIGALRRELAEIRKDPGLPFDRVFLNVDSRLVFSEWVRALDVLVGSGFTRIDSNEIGPGEEG